MLGLGYQCRLHGSPFTTQAAQVPDTPTGAPPPSCPPCCTPSQALTPGWEHRVVFLQCSVRAPGSLVPLPVSLRAQAVILRYKGLPRGCKQSSKAHRLATGILVWLSQSGTLYLPALQSWEGWELEVCSVLSGTSSLSALLLGGLLHLLPVWLCWEETVYRSLGGNGWGKVHPQSRLTALCPRFPSAGQTFRMELGWQSWGLVFPGTPQPRVYADVEVGRGRMDGMCCLQGAAAGAALSQNNMLPSRGRDLCQECSTEAGCSMRLVCTDGRGPGGSQRAWPIHSAA